METQSLPSTVAAPNATPDPQVAPAKPKPTRVRRAVSPEIAANVREESEAVAATINAAQAVANAAITSARAAAEAVVTQAVARRDGAFRPILRQLGIDEDRGTIVATEGAGADTLVVIELSPPDEEVPNV